MAFFYCGVADLVGTRMQDSSDVIHLMLRGRGPQALVRDAADWAVLSEVAGHMLFWCGGFIHGCRCEGPQIHFALGLARAPIGSVVRHLCGAYAAHLRKRYGWSGGVFKHYIANVLEAELFLDDLVIWLHRPASGATWTADDAYRTPNSMTWITTHRVREMLGGSGLLAYRRRQAEPMAEHLLAALVRAHPVKEHSADAVSANPSWRSTHTSRNVRTIALIVARQNRRSLRGDDVALASSCREQRESVGRRLGDASRRLSGGRSTIIRPNSLDADRTGRILSSAATRTLRAGCLSLRCRSRERRAVQSGRGPA